MPRMETTYFGEMDYAADSVFQFPAGLPGFESERAFLFLQQPDTEPLMFMQSLFDPKLCFLLLPVLAADPNYRTHLNSDQLSELHLPPEHQPRIGEDILCAAILCAGDETRLQPTVNLMAPIVLNLKERIGMQVIQEGSSYSCQHTLSANDQELAPCS